MKKFLKQVGNIVAVQAVAGAATELGKAFFPKVKEKLNGLLDKANELNKAKETRKEVNELVKNTASHFKKVKEEKKAAVTTPPAEPVATDDVEPPVDAKFPL